MEPQEASVHDLGTRFRNDLPSTLPFYTAHVALKVLCSVFELTVHTGLMCATRSTALRSSEPILCTCPGTAYTKKMFNSSLLNEKNHTMYVCM